MTRQRVYITARLYSRRHKGGDRRERLLEPIESAILFYYLLTRQVQVRNKVDNCTWAAS